MKDGSSVRRKLGQQRWFQALALTAPSLFLHTSHRYYKSHPTNKITVSMLETYFQTELTSKRVNLPDGSSRLVSNPLTHSASTSPASAPSSTLRRVPCVTGCRATFQRHTRPRRGEQILTTQVIGAPRATAPSQLISQKRLTRMDSGSV